MDICNSGHVEIVFDSLTCPMCALKANKDGEIDTLRDDVLELTGKIEELEAGDEPDEPPEEKQ